MPTTLNQILGVEHGVKARAETDVTAMYQMIQKPQLLQGILKSYVARAEDGEAIPPEEKRTQAQVESLLEQIQPSLVRLFDVSFTRSATNAVAHADVTIEGETTPILTGVPVDYLMFLERQLVNLHTLAQKLPTHDPATRWDDIDEAGEFRSVPVQTTRSKKLPFNHVRSAATDKHPAQVDVLFDDRIVGDYTTVALTGTIPERRKRELLLRVEKLQRAVKMAREAANNTEVVERTAGAALLGYLFAR